MPDPDVISAFQSRTPDQQKALLAKMSDQQKSALYGEIQKRISARQTVSTMANTTTPKSFIDRLTEIQKPNPNSPALSGEEAMRAIGNIGAGGLGVLLHPINTVRNTIQPLKDVLPSYTWTKFGPIPIPNPNIIPAAEGVRQQITSNPLGTAEAAIGQAAATEIGGNVIPRGMARGVGAGVDATAEALRSTYGPEDITIGNQKVPVLKGEAHPETGPGHIQKVIKESGVGARRFDRFAQQQQEQVKSIIRQTAQQTSDLIGPVSQQPYAALDDASAAVFNRAKPMYQALDASLTRVPVKLTQVSKIMSDAIARARKLGIEIDQSENVQGAGAGDVKSLQPLTVATQLRSALLRAKRAAIDSGDASLANSVSDEIRTLHNEIDSTLSGTPLHSNWLEANRLWAKGHAISDTARAFYQSTKGTPEGIQSPQMSAVPTKVSGPSLVSRLNDLKREGTLDRGFTPEEQLNLRRSADILDRAREAAGRDTGVTPGHLYSLHSALWRTLLRLPSIPLVRAMTTTEGMRALALAEKAKNSAQMQSALRTLYPLIAAGGYNARKGTQ